MAWIFSGFTDEAGAAIDTQVATARAAGLTHVDLRNVEGHNITKLPPDVAKQVQEKLQAAGLKVLMFGSPIGKIDVADDFAPELEKLRHLALLKPIFNCDKVRLFSYYNKKGAPADKWRAESISRLSQLKKLARDLGLTLYHENERHIFGDRCAEVLVLLDALRDRGPDATFKAIFDFDNYNQSGDDVWQNWVQLRDKTDAFHLKDSDRQHQHVPVGHGAGQVKKILADAVARKWDGPVILEPHLTHSAAVLATGVSGQANQALKNLDPGRVWQIAADAARSIFREVGATVR